MTSPKYRKGANFERFLVNLFWQHGWVAVRVAGSGAVHFPVPDIIAAQNGNVLLIECKTTKSKRLSIKEAIKKLRDFALIAGIPAYIAVKFDGEKPRFFELRKFLESNRYTVKIEDDYIGFEVLTGQQMRLNNGKI